MQNMQSDLILLRNCPDFPICQHPNMKFSVLTIDLYYLQYIKVAKRLLIFLLKLGTFVKSKYKHQLIGERP